MELNVNGTLGDGVQSGTCTQGFSCQENGSCLKSEFVNKYVSKRKHKCI